MKTKCLTITIALLAAASANAQDATAPFTLRQVAPGVYAAIDREARAGANAGFVIGDDGVVVIDTFQYPEAATRLLAEIRRLTPLPIRYVVNTHHHIDHVAGDRVLRAAGAILVAQRNVEAWLRTENLKFYTAEQTKERALVASLPLPDILVGRGLTLRVGGRRVELLALGGHTGGDLIVVVPDAKVVFCGDLAWRRFAPSLVDATVSTWRASLDTLVHRADAASYSYVPGQGDVATLTDVRDFAQYLAELRDATLDAMRSGAAVDSLVAAVMPVMRATYGRWEQFDRMIAPEVGFMAAELAGTKRVPQVVASP